jgi:hypothetical protein
MIRASIHLIRRRPRLCQASVVPEAVHRHATTYAPPLATNLDNIAPLKSISMTARDCEQPRSSDWSNTFAAMVGLSTLFACQSFASASACETATEQAVSSTPQSTTGEEDDGGVDPYDNLPDEDEETSCSMCKTFRKGPCRPFWRKLEHCFKDHEKEKDGAEQCMRYFNPHHQCLGKYTNLYQLVSLEAKQELVDDTEKSVSKDERRPWNPEIDWTMWKRFCHEDNGLALKPQTIPSANKDAPYWKRLPDDVEPLLITLSSNLPLEDTNGLLLKVAYAVDQDGFVLGFSFNNEYGKLMDAANGRPPNEAPSGDESNATAAQATADTAQENTRPPHMTFEFIVLPGETKNVRVVGLYSENPVAARPDKDILDAMLYKSKAHCLAKIAEESA